MTPTAVLALTPLLMPDWLDPAYIIEKAGPWTLPVVALIIFAECGIFSILPGDSLLFTVGMFMAVHTGAGTAVISYGGSVGTTMVVVFVTLVLAAILGNVSGYWIGRVIGPPIFKPRSSWVGRKLFNPVYVDKTHDFFEKYGNRALILARFVPLVRTFVTLVAGVAKMSFRQFITYTAVGGVLWVVLVTLLGYFLGQIAFIRENIDAALVLIVLVSLLPMIIEYLNHRRQEKAVLPADPS
ncbi:MAG: VTT domain-containing protein [Actinomycetia bacterium]|nr:VTT domain-containing protein [Actinomycetes bacterium]